MRRAAAAERQAVVLRDIRFHALHAGIAVRVELLLARRAHILPQNFCAEGKTSDALTFDLT